MVAPFCMGSIPSGFGWFLVQDSQVVYLVELHQAVVNFAQSLAISHLARFGVGLARFGVGCPKPSGLGVVRGNSVCWQGDREVSPLLCWEEREQSSSGEWVGKSICVPATLSMGSCSITQGIRATETIKGHSEPLTSSALAGKALDAHMVEHSALFYPE